MSQRKQWVREVLQDYKKLVLDQLTTLIKGNDNLSDDEKDIVIKAIKDNEKAIK